MPHKDAQERVCYKSSRQSSPPRTLAYRLESSWDWQVIRPFGRPREFCTKGIICLCTSLSRHYAQEPHGTEWLAANVRFAFRSSVMGRGGLDLLSAAGSAWIALRGITAAAAHTTRTPENGTVFLIISNITEECAVSFVRYHFR